MSDDKGQDDKIIAVHVDDPSTPLPGRGRAAAPPPQGDPRFFLDYKVLENKAVDVVTDPRAGGRRAGDPRRGRALPRSDRAGRDQAGIESPN
jgi:hypothetical protein